MAPPSTTAPLPRYNRDVHWQFARVLFRAVEQQGHAVLCAHVVSVQSKPTPSGYHLRDSANLSTSSQGMIRVYIALLCV